MWVMIGANNLARIAGGQAAQPPDPALVLGAAFVTAGLAKSNSEARRQIQGGALRINDEPVTDEKAKLRFGDVKNGVIKLSSGRKRHVLLKPVE